MPVRIQRRRTKGWKMPEGAVCVTRPGRFGNPFTIKDMRECGYKGSDEDLRRCCVGSFRGWATGSHETWTGPLAEAAHKKLMDGLPSLRGKDLACWCPLNDKDGKLVPCHADVLLELANGLSP